MEMGRKFTLGAIEMLRHARGVGRVFDFYDSVTRGGWVVSGV